MHRPDKARNNVQQPDSFDATDMGSIDNSASDSHQLADLGFMYATMDQAFLLPDSEVEAIVGTLPSGVSMKRVKVPVTSVDYQIRQCIALGHAVFTQTEWTALGK